MTTATATAAVDVLSASLRVLAGYTRLSRFLAGMAPPERQHEVDVRIAHVVEQHAALLAEMQECVRVIEAEQHAAG